MYFLPPLTLLAALSLFLDRRRAPGWVWVLNFLFLLLNAIPSCMIGWFMLWMGIAMVFYR